MTWDGFLQSPLLHGLLGGLLIGLAAALMLLGAGRIAGISGIVARGTHLAAGNISARSSWPFLLGLVLGAWVMQKFLPSQNIILSDWPLLLIAGFLVGFGTRLGSGCTSGHGVCGVSRLSQRSLVATAIFMASGIATVFFMHMWG